MANRWFSRQARPLWKQIAWALNSSLLLQPLPIITTKLAYPFRTHKVSRFLAPMLVVRQLAPIRCRSQIITRLAIHQIWAPVYTNFIPTIRLHLTSRLLSKQLIRPAIQSAVLSAAVIIWDVIIGRSPMGNLTSNIPYGHKQSGNAPQ